MFDINAFLRRMNYSHGDLAAKMNVSRSKVSGWAAGYRRPDYDNLEQLLKMGMTINEMFGEEVERIVFKVQPSIDVNNLTENDCKKIVSMAFGKVLSNTDLGK